MSIVDKSVSNTLNQEQTRAVNTAQNTVLVAGAGSGKTTVLSSRILYLLITKQIPLSKILALTFTRKATAEMYARIYYSLQECIKTQTFEDITLNASQKEFLVAQRELFHETNITTFDSFSLRIAQIGASRMGHFAPLNIIENLHDEIVMFVERWLFDHLNSHLKTLLKYFSFEEFVHELLVPILQICSCFPLDLKKQFDTICKRMHDLYHQNSTQILENIDNLFLQISTACTESNTCKSVDILLNTLKEISEQLNAPQEPFQLFTYTFNLRGVTTCAPLKSIAQFITSTINSVRVAFNESNAMVRSLTHREYYQAYYFALDKLLREWCEYRTEKSLYSYEDIAEIARHTLSTHKDIRGWYNSQYEYIIVDEFQDNNQDQKNLLYMLSDVIPTDAKTHDISLPENKYFFVGDPKQSIYGFRGANIDAFLSLKTHNQELGMTTNYRSDKNLIALFNDWFSKLFDDLQINPIKISYDIQIGGEATTSDQSGNTQIDMQNGEIMLKSLLNKEEYCNVASTSQSTIRDISCLMDLIVPQNEKPDKNKYEIEAFSIANRIDTMIKNGILPKDIAILSRTKVIFPFIARFLLEYNIPFVLEDNLVSLRQDVGQDFYSWLSLLIFPQDKSAYAAILRSPLAHVSDDMVVGLLSLQSKISEENLFNVEASKPCIDNSSSQTIFDLLHKKTGERNKLSHLRDKYLQAKKILLNGSILEVLQHFWENCGYRYVLLRDKKYHVFLSSYSILKNLIVTYQSGGTVVILEHLRAILSGEIRNEFVISKDLGTQDDAVQIMSIHKSKGLEFPHVILANIHGRFKNNSSEHCAVHDGLLYVKIPLPDSPNYLLKNNLPLNTPDTIYSLTLKNKGKRDTSERLRVLYVGMTRAKKTITLSGYYSKSKSNLSSYIQWLVGMGLVPEPTEDTTTVNLKEVRLEAQSRHLVRYRQETYLLQEIDRNKSNQLSSDTTQHTVPTITNTIERELAHSVTLINPDIVLEVAPSGDSSKVYAEKREKGIGTKLPVLDLDTVLTKYNMYTTFGTYCHFLLSFYCQNKPISNIPVKLETQLLQLSNEERELFLTTTKQLCLGFIESELWQSLDIGAKVYTEYPFLMWNETHKVRVRGIIDLLVISKNRIIIIDYKVNMLKNPKLYQHQLAVYRLAIEKMFSQTIAIECYLCYLRSGELSALITTYDEDTLIGYLKNRDVEEEENQNLISMLDTDED